MLGYLRLDGTHHLPLTGEWFVTGDRGSLGPTGALTHHGRDDDILNAQGYRVSALEVEQVLLAHPGIAEAAVVALQVRRDVEVLGAIVIPTPHTYVSEDAILAHCRARLADYKQPRKICLTDTFPRTVTGKVMKRELARQFGQKGSP